MSQSLQLSQLPRLCMPLAKFSYASVHAGNSGPIPWTHIPSQNDLFVLVDPIEQPERRYRFKVLQDPNAHEDFDLTLLARGAQQAISEARASQIPGQQPSITVIVKVPCVAMRYPLQDGQIRRFQIRFSKEEDFYETLKVFSSMKVPFIEAGAGPPQPMNLNIRPAATNNNHESISNTHDARSYAQPQIYSLARTEWERQGQTSTLVKPNFAVEQPSTLPYARPFSASQPDLSTMQAYMNDQPSTATPYLQPFRTDIEDIRTFGYQNYHVPEPPASSISTYTPRPSTAPVAGTRTASSELPPRRELPFTRKGKPIPEAVNPNEDGPRHNMVQNSTTANQVATELPILALPSFSTDNSCEKGKKKASAKPRKPAAPKKPKTTTTGQAKTSSKPRKSDADAEVNHDPQDDCVQSQGESVNDQVQIDTQALLDKATAIQARRQKALVNNSHIHTIPTDENQTYTVSTTSITDTRQNTMETSTLQSEAPSISNEAQKPSNITTTTITHRPTTRSTSGHDSTIKPNNLNASPSPEPENLTRKPTSTQQNTNTTTTSPQMPPQLPFDLRTLLTIPTSPDNPTTIKATDLNNPDDRDLVENWIVGNLQNNEFLRLCQTLEGVWQTLFVKF